MCENLLLVLLYNKQFPTVNLVKVFSKTNHKGDHKRITAKKQTHDNVALLFTRSAYFIAYVNTNGELAESNRERTIELRSFTFSSIQSFTFSVQRSVSSGLVLVLWISDAARTRPAMFTS